MADKYEVQVINSGDGINYRITDKNGDNRIATSYENFHAELIVNALNFYHKYSKAVKDGIIIAGVVVEN